MARSSLPRFFLRANTALRQLTVTFHSGPQGVGRPLLGFSSSEVTSTRPGVRQMPASAWRTTRKSPPLAFLGVRHDDEHDRGTPGAQFSFNAN